MKMNRFLFAVLTTLVLVLFPITTHAGMTTVVLRASAATSGAAEQDSAVTLTHAPGRAWLVIDKTAEANADNILTVRLQAQVGDFWVDVPYTSTHISGVLTVAADVASDVTVQGNAVDVYTALAVARFVTVYKDIPSKVVRVISINSGTTAANTFSATLIYQ